jgi:uncharacterized membrane protein required for colicin V production
MNLLDGVILLLLLGNVVLGYAFGIVRRAVALVGVFAGVGAATLISPGTSLLLANNLGWQSALWAHVVTYSGIVVFMVVLFEILAAVYDRHIRALVAPMFDRLAGTLAGLAVGAFEVTLLLIIGIGLVNSNLPAGYAYPPGFLTLQQQYYGSLLAPHFLGLEPLTRAIFSMVLPGDVNQYFTQVITNH